MRSCSRHFSITRPCEKRRSHSANRPRQINDLHSPDQQPERPRLDFRRDSLSQGCSGWYCSAGPRIYRRALAVTEGLRVKVRTSNSNLRKSQSEIPSYCLLPSTFSSLTEVARTPVHAEH